MVAAAAIAAVVLFVLVVGIVAFRGPGARPRQDNGPQNRVSPPQDDRFADAQADETLALVENALRADGLEGGAAGSATQALHAYVDAVATQDFERYAAIAAAHDAIPDPLLLEQAKRVMTVRPARAIPEGFERWSDKEVLHRVLFADPFQQWREIDYENVDTVLFDGPGVLVDELLFYRIGDYRTGFRASMSAPPFSVSDLERRLQQGEARGCIVTFEVVNHEDKRQQVSVLLGEDAPGSWYPVRHKSILHGAP